MATAVNPMTSVRNAVLLLALLTPAVWAQPVSTPRRITAPDVVTGVDEAPPGMEMGVPRLDPALMKDYVRAVEALDMSIDFQARGATREALGVERVKIDAKWERRPGESSARLAGATITPVGGRLKMGGFSINKITIDRDGKMRLDIKNFPDITVNKITKNENGDVRLHLNWLPDITIKREGNVKLLGFIGLGNVGNVGGLAPDVWPPRLEDVMAILENKPASSGTTPGMDATVSWDITGRASPTALPIPGMNLPVGSNVHLRGTGELTPDGRFRTIGENNSITLDLQVGPGSLASGPIRGDVRSATVRLEGTYGVSAAGNGGPFNLTADGAVSYRVEGSNIVMALPTGTTVSAGAGVLSGNATLATSVGSGRAPRVTLRDGRYKLDITGPIRLTGLRASGVSAESLGFTGGLHSEGTFTAAPTRGALSFDGNLEGDLVADRNGVVNVLTGDMNATGTVAAGSRVRVDLDRVRGNLTPSTDASRRRPDVSGVSGSGRISGGLDVVDVAVTTSAARVSAARSRLDFDAALGGSTTAGLTNASGTARLRLDSDGSVTANLGSTTPGAAATPEGTHRVVAGDTLSAIARRYGTTVAALREKNGITGSTIRVGQLLQIPGRASSAPTTGGGSVTTTIGAGSEVALVVSSARIGRDGSFDVSGAISSRLTLKDVDLRTGAVEAKILGLARASLDTTFRARRAAGGNPELATGTIRIPVRIEINAGSKVKVNLPGRAATDITMDRNGSYAELTAIVKVEGGRPRVEELQKCDLFLISNAAARLGGDMITIGGEKSVRFQGRVAIKSNGLDLFGDITVRVHGNDHEPIVSIRW